MSYAIIMIDLSMNECNTTDVSIFDKRNNVIAQRAVSGNTIKLRRVK